MHLARYFAALLAAVVLLLACGSTSIAQVTAEQRQELTQLRRDLGKVTSLIRQKKLDEVEEILDAAEEKLKSIADDVGVEPTDRKMQGVSQLLKRHRGALDKQRERAGGNADAGASFSKDVAPIIADACLGCHGSNNPRANLRLDTFAGWKRGGRSGALLAAGNAKTSLLMARLTATNANQRMPRGRDALPSDDLQAIAAWINQGAKFDGASEDTALGELAEAAEAENDPTVVIPKPTGDETVSFTRDIAPFMANLCSGCHSENRRSGGLSVVSFYDIMKGGDSGRVILPGNVEGSRLFRLVGGLENPRMPQGQARITRKNYEDLKQWFVEGNTYDGENPRTPLREFVRTDADMEAERFANLSPEEFNKLRIDRTEDQFKRALPNDAFNMLQSDEFYLIGNVGADRLRQVDEWSQDQLRTLKKMFSGGEGQAWKGRLAIFVFKDRFGYDEFNIVINRREAPREMTGHSVIVPSYEDAYIALLDVGDEGGEESPALRVNLIDHITGAYLKRGGTQLPDWVLRGTGLALAVKALPGDPYLRVLPNIARQNVLTLGDPQDVFADGTFSPATIGPVGLTLVDYMLDSGGSAKYARFIRALQDGQDTAAAVRGVYNADLSALAGGYAGSLRN